VGLTLGCATADAIAVSETMAASATDLRNIIVLSPARPSFLAW
jgi:hypothetical protein